MKKIIQTTILLLFLSPLVFGATMGNLNVEKGATVIGHLTFEGVTSTGATGTGKLVFDTSPVFTTPNIGSATGSVSGNAATVTTNANLSGDVSSSGNTTTLTVPYSFSCWRNAAVNTGNWGYAVVAFDNEVFDTGNNVASGVFTAPVNGIYHFDGRVSIAISTSLFMVALYVDNAEYARGGDMRYTGTSGITVSSTIKLAANATVDLRTMSDAARALETGQAICYFSGYLVSRY